MTDVLDGVRDHYRATGLTERLKTALTAFGPDEQRLTPQQLATLDQFHTRGLAATVELAKLAGITADLSVLDVGSGVGGPARFPRRAQLGEPGVGGLRVVLPCQRAETGRVCDLRRRVEQRRAALSRPLGTNAGHEPLFDHFVGAGEDLLRFCPVRSVR
jgi:hypothetical protein